jgi:hypothetical protein
VPARGKSPARWRRAYSRGDSSTASAAGRPSRRRRSAGRCRRAGCGGSRPGRRPGPPAAPSRPASAGRPRRPTGRARRSRRRVSLGSWLVLAGPIRSYPRDGAWTGQGAKVFLRRGSQSPVILAEIQAAWESSRLPVGSFYPT